MPEPWWKSAVLYQIYPRSLCDANGDGIGDLEGIRRRLDHIQRLGVDGVWLSPFYRSPMADFGYDVRDYRGVDGFRVDVVHMLGTEPEDLRFEHDAKTHEIIRGLRRVLEEYDGDRMMVGEVYILSTARVARYYGNGDELHLAFNFPPLYAP